MIAMSGPPSMIATAAAKPVGPKISRDVVGVARGCPFVVIIVRFGHNVMKIINKTTKVKNPQPAAVLPFVI